MNDPHLSLMHLPCTESPLRLRNPLEDLAEKDVVDTVAQRNRVRREIKRSSLRTRQLKFLPRPIPKILKDVNAVRAIDPAHP
jgi:hypothetical protein